MTLLQVLFAVLCCMVFASAFCRLVKVSAAHTLDSVSISVFLTAAASAYALFSMIFWGWEPTWVACAILGSQSATLLATARAWKIGVPWAYRKPSAENI